MRGPDPIVAARLAATSSGDRWARAHAPTIELPVVKAEMGDTGFGGNPAPAVPAAAAAAADPEWPKDGWQEPAWLDEPWPDEAWREQAWLDEPWPLEARAGDGGLAALAEPLPVVQPQLAVPVPVPTLADLGGWLPDTTLLEHARRALIARLPEPLRAGRWQPGRAGVAAVGLLAALALVFAAVVVVRGRSHAVPAAAGAALPDVVSTPLPSALLSSAAPLVVDVEGRVKHPGVRQLATGERVADAIAAAGGVLPGTNATALDLASRLTDGEQIRVGLSGAATSGTTGGTDSSDGGTPSGPVDLNTATETDLETLPGVGPVMAGRILAWRSAHGPFTGVGQLQQISGVGPATYARLSPLVSV